MSADAVVGAVTCGARVARCCCVKAAGHAEAGDSVHGCDAGCGGSWAGSLDAGTFEVVTFPGGIGLLWNGDDE